jgi:hypothetical protein
MACDTQSLATNAACFNCLDDHQIKAIQAYLLCQVSISPAIAGGFTSADTSFAAATLFTFAHGLSTTPRNLYGVIVNQSTDLGYTAGQEVDIRGIFHTASGTEFCSLYADSTNVYIALREGTSAAANIRLVQAAGGVAITGPDLTKWKFRIYAKL